MAQPTTESIFVFEQKLFSAQELITTLAVWLTGKDAVEYHIHVIADTSKPYLVVAKIPGVYTDGGA